MFDITYVIYIVLFRNLRKSFLELSEGTLKCIRYKENLTLQIATFCREFYNRNLN